MIDRHSFEVIPVLPVLDLRLVRPPARSASARFFINTGCWLAFLAVLSLLSTWLTSLFLLPSELPLALAINVGAAVGLAAWAIYSVFIHELGDAYRPAREARIETRCYIKQHRIHVSWRRNDGLSLRVVGYRYPHRIPTSESEEAPDNPGTIIVNEDRRVEGVFRDASVEPGRKGFYCFFLEVGIELPPLAARRDVARASVRIFDYENPALPMPVPSKPEIERKKSLAEIEAERAREQTAVLVALAEEEKKALDELEANPRIPEEQKEELRALIQARFDTLRYNASVGSL
jgi:hypothetical protein